METQKRFQGFKRESLEKKLESIAEVPLIMVVAPMGYGKTTVVTSFLRKHKHETCVWLSLGQNEVDGTWVWQRMCHAVGSVAPDLSDQLVEMGLPATNSEIENFISLMQERVIKKSFLIIDDYQECKDQVLNRLLVRMAYEDMPMLRIILISRQFPSIPYEVMMLKGYCDIIDQQMLTLTMEEINQIFLDNQIVLTEKELNDVYQYTDGWIAAVYLSMMDYHKIGQFRLSVSIRHLLKTSAYDQMPDKMQEIVMKMSLFDSFNLAEARYTAESDIPAIMLEETMNRFGFIGYNARTGIYGMHALLRAVGEAELGVKGVNKSVLYHRYAEYNERTGNMVPAIINYDKAGEPERVLELLQRDQNWEYIEVAPVIMESFFDKTGLDLCAKYLDVYIAYLYHLFMNRNVKKGRRLYEQIVAYYCENVEQLEQMPQNKVSFSLMETVLMFNRLDEMNLCLKHALECKVPGQKGIFSMMPLTFDVPETLVLFHRRPGGLKEIIEEEKEYASLYTRLTLGGGNGWDSLYDSEYSLSTGDVEEAERLAELTLKRAKIQRKTCIVISCYTILLRCAICLGKTESFQVCRQELEEWMKSEHRPIFQTDYEICMGYTLALIGQTEQMAPWLQNFDLSECNYVMRSIRCGCRGYGIKLCVEEQWGLLDAVAEEMLVPYGKSRHIFVELQAHIFKAIALTHQNQEQAGLEYLKRGVAMAAQDEIRMPFMELGFLISPLLSRLAREIPYAGELLEYCKKYQRGHRLFLQDEGKTVLLTAREMELMELVKQGYRNADIAKKLNIALVTVEKNLTSIYRKLGVKNRIKAVQMLKNLGGGVKKVGLP